MTGPNGTSEQALAELVYANYPAFTRKLGAINILLADLPLEAMLAANRRHQSSSVLLLPPNTTAEHARAIAAAHRADEKVIEAALALQRSVVVAIAEQTAGNP